MINLEKGDRRTELYRDFWPILEEVGKFHHRFLKEWELSPFEFTEQTTVGAFSWAAARKNFLCLNEYQILKSKKPGKKPKANGRADFWIDFVERSYSLEFKRAKLMANSTNLSAKFGMAKSDIKKVDPEEHDRACAVLSAYVNNSNKTETYQNFAKNSDVDLAVRLGDAGESDVFLYFSLLRD